MNPVPCNGSSSAIASAEIVSDYPSKNYFGIVFQQGKPTVKLANNRAWDFIPSTLDVPINIRRCNETVSRSFVKFQGPQIAKPFDKPFGLSAAVPAPIIDLNNFTASTPIVDDESGEAALRLWWPPDGLTIFVIFGVAMLLLLLLCVLLLLITHRRRRRAFGKLPVFSSPIRIADPENAIRQISAGNGYYAAVATPDLNDTWEQASDNPLLVPCTYDELKVFDDEGGHSQLSLSAASFDFHNHPPPN